MSATNISLLCIQNVLCRLLHKRLTLQNEKRKRRLSVYEISQSLFAMIFNWKLMKEMICLPINAFQGMKYLYLSRNAASYQIFERAVEREICQIDFLGPDAKLLMLASILYHCCIPSSEIIFCYVSFYCHIELLPIFLNWYTRALETVLNWLRDRSEK